jgi:hypothetical protein
MGSSPDALQLLCWERIQVALALVAVAVDIGKRQSTTVDTYSACGVSQGTDVPIAFAVDAWVVQARNGAIDSL